MMRNKRRWHFWPWRSPGNRRRHHRYAWQEWHYLDVKVDSRKSRRIRKVRKATGLIKVLAIVFSLLTLTAAVRWTYRAVFFSNDEFRLSRLQVQTDGVMTEAELAAAGDIHQGMNLLAIDLDGLQKKITGLPMVKSARVSRELPDRLIIEVKERAPVAWLSCPPHGVKPRDTARGFLVDEEGKVFRCHKLLNRFMNLPVIETFQLSEPSDDIQLESGPVLRAIDLIAGSHRLFEPDGIAVEKVSLEKPYALICRYSNGMEATFGVEDYGRGLKDLRWIVSHSQAAGKNIATANLIPRRNIPVTFRAEIRPIPQARVRSISVAGASGEAMAPEPEPEPGLETAPPPRKEAPATLRRVPPKAASDRANQLRAILNGG